MQKTFSQSKNTRWTDWILLDKSLITKKTIPVASGFFEFMGETSQRYTAT